MTYRELLEKLKTLSPEQLDMNVHRFATGPGELYELDTFCTDWKDEETAAFGPKDDIYPDVMVPYLW